MSEPAYLDDADVARRDHDSGGGSEFALRWIGQTAGRAERRQVVVLAVGFAPSRSIDLEAMLEAQARERRHVARIVARFGGAIGRVDPDTQLAAWGWRSACEADTRLAVAAALEIAADTTLDASCGVDAGIAVTPDTEEQLPGFDFVGGMIGAATAQQAVAAPGEVVVSDTVRWLVGAAFEITERPGIGEGAPLWSARRKAPLRPRTRGGEGRLVGREGEIARIKAEWDSAHSGVAALLAVVGEAGVGKSALVGRLERKALRSAGSFILLNCLPERQQVQLEQVRTLVEQLARLHGPLSPPIGHGLLVDAAPFSGEVVGAELTAVCRARLEAEPERLDHLGIADALAAVIAHKSAGRPLVIVIEDVQWADRATLLVLAALGRLAGRKARALIVATCRSEQGEALAAFGPGWSRLEVARLAPAHIERLLLDGKHGSKLSERVRQRIADLTDGIPLYACELARLCTGMGELDQHPRLLSSPNRLNAALTNRLDALATLKPLAQVAAVLGRLFDSRLLAATLDMDVRVVDERLDMLVRMGILARRRRQQAFQYRFEKALLWTQAYGSVVASRRRRLHLKIAAALSSELGASLDPPAELIAHHWSKGGERGKAFRWWSKAAQAAARKSSATNAVAYAQEALAAKQQLPEVCSAHEEATLLGLLGTQLRVLRGSLSGEAVSAYEQALQVVATIPGGSSDLDLEISWGLVSIQIVRGELNHAAVTSTKLIAEAMERRRDDIVLLGLRAHGTCRLMSGAIAEAIETFTDVASRYDRHLHGELCRRYVSDPGAVALAHRALAQTLAGQREAALASRQRALALAGALGHSHTTANVLGIGALAAALEGEGGIAAALAHAGLSVAQQHRHSYWIIRTRQVIAWERSLREPARGLELMETELERYQGMGIGRSTLLPSCLAAEIAIRADRPGRALELVVPLRSRGERSGEWVFVPELLRLEALASARLDGSSLPRALALLAEAEALAREHGSLLLVERTLATRRELETRSGGRGTGLKRGRSPAARRIP